MSWHFVRNHLPLRHPSVVPEHAGWYVRDWRGTGVLPESDRVLCIDLWVPVPDASDILHPGEWYVVPILNDASEQRLPWRVPLASELEAFARLFPKECIQAGSEFQIPLRSRLVLDSPSAAMPGASFY